MRGEGDSEEVAASWQRECCFVPACGAARFMAAFSSCYPGVLAYTIWLAGFMNVFNINSYNFLVGWETGVETCMVSFVA